MDSTNNKKIIDILEGISNKRARIVIEHILKYDFVTTEELEEKYGYKHPPRAARDVREYGIPLETFRIKSNDNKSIAAYKFSNFEQIKKHRLHGRTTFPKKFKIELFRESHGKCSICNSEYDLKYFQIDHRIPYQISIDEYISFNSKDFMLLCGSCNRAKSWSCEHCTNWNNFKKIEYCWKCYWSNPHSYSHIAMNEIRRIDIQFDKNELESFELLNRLAEEVGIRLPQLIKSIIIKYLTEMKKLNEKLNLCKHKKSL